MSRILLTVLVMHFSMGLAGPTVDEPIAATHGQGATRVVNAIWRAFKAAAYQAAGTSPAEASPAAERRPSRPVHVAATPAPSAPRPLAATKNVKGDEVIVQRCTACHGGKQRVVQNFNVMDLNALKASGYIVFGSPEQSRIWQRVGVVDDMPPAQVKPLSLEEKESIRVWLAGRDVPPKKDVIATVQDDDRLRFLLKIAQVSGALELMKNPGPFTILAPTDRAFSEWGESRCQALLDKNNADAAKQLLLNHGVLGRYLAKDLEKLRKVASARGFMLTISRSPTDQRLWIGPNNAVVVEEDIVCSNGVLHIIDRVMAPQDLLPGTRGSYITKIGLKMTEIPGGTFAMGSASPAEPGTENEVPQRNVRLSTFYLSEHEVTWQQYQHRALELNNPAPEWIRQIPPGQKPVGSVSWIQAAEFCNKLSRLEGLEPYYAIAEGDEQTKTVSVPAPEGNGYRLPTEAEWEFAARAGTTGKFFFGDDPATLGEYAWYGENSEGTPNAVKMKKPNDWGLYDMYGNVAEWCDDWFGPYPEHSGAQPLFSPRGPATPPSNTKLKVYRGGSYIRPPACCRSAWRGSAIIDFQHQAVGFRVARTPPKPSGMNLLVPGLPAR